MLAYSAGVRGYDQVMTILVDLGAQQNSANLAALNKSLTIYEALCLDGKCEEAIVRLANGTQVKSEGVYVEIAFSFSDFSCKEKSTVVVTYSPYDPILGMSWLVKYHPWMTCEAHTVYISTQDTEKDVLLLEAEETDAGSNTVKNMMTFSHTSPSTTQIDDFFVVIREMTLSQALQIPVQI